MTIWTPDLARYRGPRYRALTDAIAEAVADGTLSPDSKLPPHRDLAYALGLSIGTVTRAYKDAERRDLVCGEVGRGTYVRSPTSKQVRETLWAPTRSSDGPISLVMNLPPVGIAAPALAQTFQELSETNDLGALLDHQSSGRIEAHLNSAAAWLARLGLDTTGDEIVLTNGAQHGILMALMACVNPGDTVLVENMTYPPLKQMAHHFGIKLHGLEMDEEGIIPDALEAACQSTNTKLLYCMPTLQSPTGSTMGAQRRLDIIEVTRKHELTIIEDDVFGFLPKERPSPLAALAPERTIFISSVSKSLAPGLRIGIVRVPEHHREALRNAVQMSCWMPSPITAEIAHRWIEDGTADKLNSWLQTEMESRCKFAHDILGRHAQSLNGLSYHLWIKLPEGWTEESFRAACEQRDVKVATGEIFLLKPGTGPQSLRLALGYETSRERLKKGLSVVADLLNADGARRPSIV
jgi:DNA-binding transcriptional MocR family regulator